MKIVLIISLISFLGEATDAQWFWQNPLPGGNNLYDIKFVNNEIGWAVGAMGTIVKTTDAGQTWNIQPSGTTKELNAVSFAEEFIGTAVGDSGTVIRTEDGGITWVAQDCGSTAYNQDVFSPILI